jgi:hypothetical protein
MLMFPVIRVALLSAAPGSVPNQVPSEQTCNAQPLLFPASYTVCSANLLTLLNSLPWESASTDSRHTKALIVGGCSCSKRTGLDRCAGSYLYLEHTQ